MAKPAVRIGALRFFVLLGSAAMVARAGYLQLIKGGMYAERAEAARTVRRALEPHRGTLYDSRGTPLALSFERFHFGVNPLRVPRAKRDTVVALVRADLQVSTARLQAAFDGRVAYFYAHGPFSASQVERLRDYRGIELTSVYRRSYPLGRLARPLIGSVPADSAGRLSGLERFLDSLIRGQPGEAVLIRDAARRVIESPGRVVRSPVAGHDVILTIDRELQEIAEAALDRAFVELSPARGDVLFLDPKRGEVLAAASRARDDSERIVATASFFRNAFEPGSTAKPFTAAALLQLGRVDAAERVSGEGGTWVVEGRQRPIRDDHPQEAPISLARAVQVSSNIGMAKFAAKLRPAEHYDMLRAFGFGSPTGIEYGGEAAGSLPRPHRWRPGQQSPSVAMGYAFEVTPIQLASAYAAIANGGLLLAPAIVREIRDPLGRSVYRHRPTVVRRVISREVATRLRSYLALAVEEEGTGERGRVRGGVLGKTGTAKLVVNRVYTNRYAASFAAIYPAKDPQLVVIVRIEDPRTDRFYGGLVAAPLTASMLRQALAARQTPLDRTRLADGVVRSPHNEARGPRDHGEAVAVPWPLPAADAGLAPSVELPELRGKNTREAAYALHRRGLRVHLVGNGVVVNTKPGAGSTVTRGATVTVTARPRTP